MSALIPINNVNVSFEVVGDEIFANSLQIAEVFEKNHAHILRSIDKLPNDEFKSENFKFDSYFDKKGEQRRMINLTRDGFSLLVMGFTGEKAYKWKIEFIKAFNLMEAELKRQGVIRYTSKIADLEATNRLEAKHHQDQINGYLGKLAVVNKANEVLRAELIVARSKPDKSDQIQRLEAMLHNTRLDRDFYMKRYHELQKTTKAKEHKAVLAIDAIQSKMEQVFTAMGAVKTYIHDGDEYFLNNNELLRG